MPDSLSETFWLATKVIVSAVAMDAFVFGTLGLDAFQGIWASSTPHMH